MLLLVLGRSGGSTAASGGSAASAAQIARSNAAAAATAGQQANDRLSAVLNYANARDAITAKSATDNRALDIQQLLGIAKIQSDSANQQAAIAAARDTQMQALANDKQANQYAYNVAQTRAANDYQLGLGYLGFARDYANQQSAIQQQKIASDQQIAQGRQQGDFFSGFLGFLGSIIGVVL